MYTRSLAFSYECICTPSTCHYLCIPVAWHTATVWSTCTQSILYVIDYVLYTSRMTPSYHVMHMYTEYSCSWIPSTRNLVPSYHVTYMQIYWMSITKHCRRRSLTPSNDVHANTHRVYVTNCVYPKHGTKLPCDAHGRGVQVTNCVYSKLGAELPCHVAEYMSLTAYTRSIAPSYRAMNMHMSRTITYDIMSLITYTSRMAVSFYVKAHVCIACSSLIRTQCV